MDLKTEIDQTAQILRKGGIVLIPTDTIWGIACDATNSEAVQKVYDIKEREQQKALVVLVHDLDEINIYAEGIPEVAWDIVEYSTSPLTVVFDQGKNVAANLCAEDGSIAIRWCREEFCQRVMQRLGRPIVATSANISGDKSPTAYATISDKIKDAVDHIVPLRQEEKNMNKASKIIKIGKDGTYEVLRD